MRDVIYFVMCEQGNYVKIGHSTDKGLRHRISGLQMGCPFKLKLIRTTPGLPWHEAWLHERFASLHFRGEWFNYCDDMLTIDLPPVKGKNYYVRTQSIEDLIADIYEEEPHNPPYAPFEKGL